MAPKIRSRREICGSWRRGAIRVTSFILVVLLWLVAVVFGSSSRALAQDDNLEPEYGCLPCSFGCLGGKITQVSK